MIDDVYAHYLHGSSAPPSHGERAPLVPLFWENTSDNLRGVGGRAPDASY